jgi:hypothetical protein
MGDGAAQDGGMQAAIMRKVIDVFSAAAQKAEVLEPFNRAADE